MADSYRVAVNSSNHPPQPRHPAPHPPQSKTPHGRMLRAGHYLDAVPEESPTTEAPPFGVSYRAAVGSTGNTATRDSNASETVMENSDGNSVAKSAPAGYSYRVAVGDPVMSNFQGGFTIPDDDEFEDKRNIPGYSYRVAVGEPARKTTDVDIEGLESPGSDPKKPKKGGHHVSFNPGGDSNVNPAFEETGSRTVSNTSLNSIASSKGDPVYHVTSDGRVLKQVIMSRPDGSKVIVTDADRRCHHPIKERHVKLLYFSSIVAIILFFPTGIPAFIYARRTKMKYYEGFDPTTLYKTNKFAKRTERLIIASLVIAVLIIIIVSIAVTTSGGGSSSGGRVGLGS